LYTQGEGGPIPVKTAVKKLTRGEGAGAYYDGVKFATKRTSICENKRILTVS